ncbi:MAG: TIM barrel protein [candidate division KSB1 bacterium]|jgi:sugar phosphate isomerase/epimerase|nr:TIM barrel protein [candidate division KSB1 bacterium]
MTSHKGMHIVPGIMSYSYHLSFLEGKINGRDFMERSDRLGMKSTEWCHFPCHEPGKVDWAQVKLLHGMGVEKNIACSISGFAPLLSSGPDRDDMLKMVDTQIEVSQAIGSNRLRFHGMTEIELGIGPRPDIERCTDNLKRVVEKGEKAGIVIALENHMDFCAEYFRHFFRNIDSPFLKINLDTGNFIPLGEDVLTFTEEFADRIISCHFKGLKYIWKDYGAVLTSCHPDESIVPLVPILNRLSECRHKIDLHIEVVAMESESEDRLVAEYAKYLMNYLSISREESAHV